MSVSSSLRHAGGAVDAGVLEPVAAVVGRFHRPGQPIRYNPMPFAMDIASGISSILAIGAICCP